MFKNLKEIAMSRINPFSVVDLLQVQQPVTPAELVNVEEPIEGIEQQNQESPQATENFLGFTEEEIAGIVSLFDDSDDEA